MDKLRIAICEDEETEYSSISTMLSQLGIPFQCTHFMNADDLLVTYYAGRFDLLLMDIYMRGTNGVDAVARIRESDPLIPIAFITTSMDHAMDGYRYHVNRYLIKPVHSEDLEELLALALECRAHLPALQIRAGGTSVRLPYIDIRYIEQDNHTTYFYLAGGKVVHTTGKLSEFEELLPSPPFLRCHKSYLVNLSYVEALDRELNIFQMNGGGCTYIRRESMREAAAMYKKYFH